MRTDNVLSEMARITHEYIELYQGDFFDYDLKTLYAERPKEFVWLVRPTGTHLLTPGNTERSEWMYLYQLFKMPNKRFYHVRLNDDGSGEITLSEKKCDEFAERMQA